MKALLTKQELRDKLDGEFEGTEIITFDGSNSHFIQNGIIDIKGTEYLFDSKVLTPKISIPGVTSKKIAEATMKEEYSTVHDKMLISSAKTFIARVNRNREILGVGPKIAEAEDFRNIYHNIIEAFPEDTEFFDTPLLNSKGHLEIVSRQESKFPLKVGDADVFSRVISVKFNIDKLSEIQTSESILRMFCTNLSAHTWAEATKRNRILQENIMLQIQKSIASLSEYSSIAFLMDRVKRMKDFNMSLKELGDVSECLTKIDLLNEASELGFISNLVRQGISADEYINDKKVLNESFARMAETDRNYYDVYNSVTNIYSNNIDITPDKRDKVAILAAGMLKTKYDGEIQRPLKMFSYN